MGERLILQSSKLKAKEIKGKKYHTHRSQYALSRCATYRTCPLAEMSSSRGVESSHRHGHIDPRPIFRPHRRLPKRVSDRSPRVLPPHFNRALGLRNGPVKTEACDARVELRDNCICIWSPLCAHTGEVPANAECKSAGFAGVSSGLGLGDGSLVCIAPLLLWPKLEMIMSMGRAFTSPKNTPPSTPTSISTNTSTTTTETTKTTAYPKGLGLDSPRAPSAAAVLVSCWLLAVGLLLLLW